MYEKSQTVRLIDVFILSPVLFYIALKSNYTITDRRIIFITALATLIYNYKNYIKNKQLGY